MQLLDTPIQTTQHSEREPAIVVDKLVKRYRKATENAVDGISFSVEPGQFFVLLGPNGAGKTTTISVLTTTLAPTSGTVRIAGFDAATHASDVRRNVGIIFQNPSLDMNLSAEENVRFHAILYGAYPYRPTYGLMPGSYKRHVLRLAEMLGLERDIFRPTKKLSGGMKRKLEIVRSLIHQPPVLFLDEPTVGLDPASRRHLWEYIKQVRRESGTTVFLTTHYLEEGESADTVCIINRGAIVAFGSPAQVKSQLVQEYVVVDTEDRNRDSLCAELEARGLSYAGQGPFRVELAGRTVHEMARAIETPLARFETHIPTLEDAYLEVVGRQ